MAERPPAGRAAGFLGRGWSFPPRFSREGGVAMAWREDDVAQSLRILFSTRPGERVMHPSYGCAIHDLVFEPMDAATEAAIGQAVRRAVLFHEPRVEVEAVQVLTRDWLEGRLGVSVRYRIRAINSRQNMVFPFYLNEGTLIAGAPRPAPEG